MSKKELDPVKQQEREEKLNKKRKRILHHRPFKNFLWWFFGVFSSFFIFIGLLAIALTCVPIKTFFGKNSTDYVSDRLGEKTVYSAVLSKDGNGNIKLLADVKINDIPMVDKLVQDILKESGLSEYVNIDTAKVSDTYINAIDSNIVNDLLSCITINPEFLGEDLGSLSILTDCQLVDSVVDTSSENFNAKLYYYKTSNGKYERAFKDDKTFVQGVNSFTQLYYPALSIVPVSEITDIVVDLMNIVNVEEVLSIFVNEGDVSSTLTSVFEGVTLGGIIDGSFDFTSIKIGGLLTDVSDEIKSLLTAVTMPESATAWGFNDITISALTSINEDGINNIPLSIALPNDSSNEQIYSILYSITGVTKGEDITIGDLQGLNAENINNLPLSIVLPVPTTQNPTQNKDIYDILVKITKPQGAESWTAEDITVGSLTSLSIDSLSDLSLTMLLPNEGENEQIYDILYSLANKDENEDITINDLKGLNADSINNVKLSNFLAVEDNADLYDILVKITKPQGAESWTAEDITVGSLTSLSIDSLSDLSLTMLLPNEGENEQIYNILYALTNKGEDEDITINDLKGLDTESFNAIKLSNFLAIEDNADLYDILVKITTPQGAESWTAEDITIGSFSGVNKQSLKNIDLESVLPKDSDSEALYNMLYALTGKDKTEKIYISDFDNIKGDSVNSIYLKDFLEIPTTENGEKNSQIYKILKGATNAESYEAITFGSLSTLDIEGIKISDLMELTGDIKTILEGALGKDISIIKVGELKTFDISSLKLVSVLPKADNEQLYSILEDVIGDADNITISNFSDFDFNRIRLSTILPNDEDSKTLYNLLNDMYEDPQNVTIAQLKSFDTNKIKLKTVIPNDSDNKQLYSILGDIFDDVDEITLKSIAQFDFNKIKLSTIIPNDEDSKTLYNLLCDMYENIEDITISDLKEFDTNKVKFSTVIPNNSDNTKLYDVLDDIFENVNEITLIDLKDFDANKVKLTTVVLKDDNKTLYDVLSDMYEDIDKIVLSDLTDFNVDNVKLETIVHYDKQQNGMLFDIIMESVGVTSHKDIKISDLSTFNIEEIKLSSIIDKASNTTLFNVLHDAYNGNEDNIKVKDLANFGLGNIMFGIILPEDENENIYKILNDIVVLGESEKIASIKLSELNERISLDNIKLSTVLTDSDNSIISALIKKDVKLGNIGSAINELTLYEVYGKDCFTTDQNKASNTENKYIFNEEEGTYTLNDNGTYYLAENKGLWSILCFDVTVNTTTGKTTTFTKSTSTLGSLDDSDLISSKISSATIRQLVDAGLISDPNYSDTKAILYTKTINEILALIIALPVA